MAISSSAIVEWAKPVDKFARNVPGIDRQIRRRLEWTWGLGYGSLDEHVRGFMDPQNLLTDETLLVFPHNDIIKQFMSRENRFGKPGVSRSDIQKMYKNGKTFEYLVLPIQLEPIDFKIPCPPAQILTSGVPPHLALCTTFGKMLYAWGAFTRMEWEVECCHLVERAAKVASPARRPALGMWQFSEIEHLYRNWVREDFAPPSFQGCELKRKSRDRDDRDEPRAKRIRLPSPTWRTASLDDVDSDDSSVEETNSDYEGFNEDYEEDRALLETTRRWAKEVGSDADEPVFDDAQIELNDGQIERGGRGRGRSVDLETPDFKNVLDRRERLARNMSVEV
ncbi:hypothetical protein C8R45DRAFT_1207685 [Mycena sanguinolenta]|nr:hypothetical protein C8R45DRAFT_1207685 [Mycena sanguinolenta]